MKKLFLALLVIGIASFFLYKSVLSSQAPFKSDLMYFVPENTSGITACNAGMKRLDAYWNTKSMKDLKALFTDSGRLTGLVAPFLTEDQKSEAAPIVEKIVKVIKAVLESKLIQLGFQIEEYVQYQTIDPNYPLPVSMALVNLSETVDFKSDFDALKSAGVPIDEEKGDDYTYYVIDYAQVFQSMVSAMPHTPNPFPNMKIYIASSGKKMGVGTDKNAIVRFFKDEKFPNKPKIFEEPKFKEAVKAIGFNDGVDFCQSYIDFKTMMMAAVNTGQESAGTNVHTPEMEKIIENMPLLSIMQTAGYEKSLSVTQQWAIKDSVIPAEAKIWVDALTSNRSYEGIENMTETAAMAWGMNAAVIAKLKEAAEKTPSVSPMLSQIPYLEIAESLKNLSFGVLQPSPGVMWPEVIVAARLDKAKELQEAVKTQVMQQLAAAGMGGIKWQEKDVAGAATSYFNTPLGVGFYLAQKGDAFISTGSEAGLNVYMASEGKTFKAKFSELGMKRLGNGLIETFVSIPDLLKLGRGMQASLSMFMPTTFQISKDYDIIANAIGEYYAGVGLTPGYVTFKVYQKPKDN